jgi:hypothetical protein
VFGRSEPGVIENKIAWIAINAFFFLGGAGYLFFADKIIDYSLTYTKPDSLAAKLTKSPGYRRSVRVAGGLALLLSIAMSVFAISVWKA